MNHLDNIILSGVNQLQEDKHCMSSLRWDAYAIVKFIGWNESGASHEGGVKQMGSCVAV